MRFAALSRYFQCRVMNRYFLSKSSGKMKLQTGNFGDGREERLRAFNEELRLMRNPQIAKRCEDYWRRLALAKKEAEALGKNAVIDKLIKDNCLHPRASGKRGRAFWRWLSVFSVRPHLL